MSKGSSFTNELSIKNEIIGLFFLFVGLFLIFSLFSFSPLDPSFFHSTASETIRNFGGRIGSEISAILINTFGYASYTFLLILLFLSVFYFSNRNVKNIISKTSGFFLFLFNLSSFLAHLKPLVIIDQITIKTGGIIGFFINEFLVFQIREWPTFLLYILLLIISFMMITKISLKHLIRLLLRSISGIVKKVGSLLKAISLKHQKKLQGKKLQQKYIEEIAPSPKIKEVKNEKRPQAKHPSRIPEETYLFNDLSDKIVQQGFQPPPITYLDSPSEKSKIDISELEEKKKDLSQRLQDFRINGEIVEYTPGPVVTTFEFVPDVGVKVKDVSGLTEDLALAVKAQYVRIERLLGKKAVGIEIPNKRREIIHLRELIESPAYQQSSSPLALAIGKTTSGEIFISDLRDMPHLLIAGATGSGKTVALHSIILSILFKASPKTVKFILIDPKRIEMVIYNSLPHLLTPVVVNPKLAKNALDWAVSEMETRYKKLAALQVRSIEQYNRKLEMMDESQKEEIPYFKENDPLPYIVIVVDELADLMITSAREIEENIARLAQKSRSVGIHLILATQRPSVDVITGTIKNNFPSRIALAVPSKHDSRTIIDQVGAEKLLGNGDMLFLPPKTASLIRVHGAYVSEQETIRVVNYLAKKEKPEFNTQIIKQVHKKDEKESEQDLDELFFAAAETVITTGHAAASHLQRKLSTGYARAARLMDQLEAKGVVSEANSKNHREILMTMDQLKELQPN